ncbi:TonB-dependent receptor [Winogradskyella maritima]|nr:TonB-dependent receptor [Winogradskyella maritima]
MNFNSEFGEDSTSAYNVVSLSVAKTFFISDDRLDAQVGVENLFDTYYSTYTDWNNIPRMGRNIYLTLSYAIN